MLGEMSRHPVISAEREAELWRRYRIERDLRAGEELILANLRFVVMVARQYHCRGVALIDLIQEGNIGLIKAVRRFRPDMGYRLTSYAIWWIRSQIQSFILGSYSMVKLGSRAQRKVFFCLARARRELRASGAGSGDPLAEDLSALARRLDVKVEELEEALRRIQGRDVSIDSSELGAGSGDLAQDAWLAAPGAADGQDDDRLAALRAALARLCPRDRFVVESRFIATPAVKLKDLAAELRVTTARVHQLEVRALQRLRTALLAGEPGGEARPAPRGRRVVSLDAARVRAEPDQRPGSHGAEAELGR